MILTIYSQMLLLVVWWIFLCLPLHSTFDFDRSISRFPFKVVKSPPVFAGKRNKMASEVPAKL